MFLDDTYGSQFKKCVSDYVIASWESLGQQGDQAGQS